MDRNQTDNNPYILGSYILIRFELLALQDILFLLNSTINRNNRSELSDLKLKSGNMLEVVYGMRKTFLSAFNRWYNKSIISNIRLSNKQNELILKMKHEVEINFQFLPDSVLIYTNLNNSPDSIPSRTIYAIMRSSETLFSTSTRQGNPLQGRIDLVPGMKSKSKKFLYTNINSKFDRNLDFGRRIIIGTGLHKYLKYVDIVADVVNSNAILNRRFADSCLDRVLLVEGGAILMSTR